VPVLDILGAGVYAGGAQNPIARGLQRMDIAFVPMDDLIGEGGVH
jgi:hypothetical protein